MAKERKNFYNKNFYNKNFLTMIRSKYMQQIMNNLSHN